MKRNTTKTYQDSYQEYLNRPHRDQYTNKQFKYFLNEIFTTVISEND
jgi:hypothetical protein